MAAAAARGLRALEERERLALGVDLLEQPARVHDARVARLEHDAHAHVAVAVGRLDRRELAAVRHHALVHAAVVHLQPHHALVVGAHAHELALDEPAEQRAADLLEARAVVRPLLGLALAALELERDARGEVLALQPEEVDHRADARAVLGHVGVPAAVVLREPLLARPRRRARAPPRR